MLTLFDRRLTAEEVEQRKQIATGLAAKLQNDSIWGEWIDYIVLFGSTVNGSSTKMSDIDLAIVTKQQKLSSRDFYMATDDIRARIKEHLNRMGIKRLTINPTICSIKWLEHPDQTKIIRPEVVNSIKLQGIRISEHKSP